MAAQAQVLREHLTDKQYEAFSKACQFIYDMNMKYIHGKNNDIELGGQLNDSGND